MTEGEKALALSTIRRRAETALARGLPATAKSWIDTYNNIKARPAAEMVLTTDNPLGICREEDT